MKRNIFIILGICVFKFGSCINPDEIPVAPFTHIPLSALWTKYTERRIIYTQEQSMLNIPEYIEFSGKIYSQNWELYRVSFTKAYSNAVPPVDLFINIELLNREIEEIQFLELKLLTSDQEFDLLNLPSESIITSEFINAYNENSFYAGNYNGNFYPDFNFKVNNTVNEYFSGFSLGIVGLPFDCYENENIVIKIKVNIFDKNDHNEYSFTSPYKRRFEENRSEQYKKIWEEIGFDEWKKYIK